eukprot:TRINITY_DN5464_c0_g1_i1.p1 TRINITY_DN5464_c0_g1~~TRINITY_DN5464_c0_g1_i1.p1  ORF type:complete len:306 (+),score=31.36 TRINITY_DN5464_c0_g1_i1:56-973(+)
MLKSLFFLFLSFSLCYSVSVGMNYETWFNSPGFWLSRHVTPLLGLYRSSDPNIIRQHTTWMKYAEIDFVHIDWSNQGNPDLWPQRPDLYAIVTSTDAVFDTLLSFPDPPQIAILLGAQSEEWISQGWLQKTADIVYQRYYQGPRARLFYHFEGKPLITIYLGTPAFSYPNAPSWNDERFTVRYMTGFLESQKPLEQRGIWSWISRDPVPISVRNGVVESMTVTPAYAGQRGWGTVDTAGRDGGTTYINQWEQVLKVRPPIVFICQWNEYAEEESPNYSNEIEPTVEFHYQFLNLTRDYVRRLKAK